MAVHTTDSFYERSSLRPTLSAGSQGGAQTPSHPTLSAGSQGGAQTSSHPTLSAGSQGGVKTPSPLRHDWSLAEVEALFVLAFPELLYRAHSLHRQFFDPTKVQVSTLLSIKTGGCPEDCKYCPQSAHFDTPVKATKLMQVEAVLAEAKKAKDAGAGRFCMGAAWREPKDRDMPTLTAMIEGVKALGMETCMTLGMLTDTQAAQLKAAGLDYYNHNLDTSEAFYHDIITTRTYRDRLDTLSRVREAGMKVCCGGIVGMGEDRADRAGMLTTLANLSEHPESVPINLLVQVEGTPLAGVEALDTLEFVRMIAVARILMPASYVRLSAGREAMDEATQALCFFAGANSIFYGEKLLTTPNPQENSDRALLEKLGMGFEGSSIESVPCKSTPSVIPAQAGI